MEDNRISRTIFPGRPEFPVKILKNRMDFQCRLSRSTINILGIFLDFQHKFLRSFWISSTTFWIIWIFRTNSEESSGFPVQTIRISDKILSIFLDFQYKFLRNSWISSTNFSDLHEFPVQLSLIFLDFQYRFCTFIWISST